MADARRSKSIFRDGLSQLNEDMQAQRVKPEPSSDVWESSRVLDVGLPAPPAELPAGTSVVLPKSGNPVFELMRDCVRRDGFTHPEEGNFIMLPREFAAILALENKSVAQVVLLVICETIGWAAQAGRHGRREWVQLGQKHFEVVCGSKSQGFYGVKTAIQKGYIIRRPYKNSFEYAIRWKEKE